MKKNSHIAITILFFAFLMPSILFAEQIDLPKDADGWTIFTPSYDSRICYIAANGDDTTAQYYNANDAVVGSDPFKPVGPIKPYSTFAAAYANTRDGYADWILFKRGEIFTGGLGTVNRSGKDSTSPFLISAYGSSGDSPVIQLNSTRGMLIGASVSYFAVSGLQFYNIDRDPTAGGEWSTPPDDAIFGYFVNRTFTGGLFEGCKFRFCHAGIYLVSDETHNVSGIIIRRNIFEYNSFGTMMNRTDGILYEENIYFHNGWYDLGNQKTHNVYHSGSSQDVFKNNIFLSSSSGHIKLTNGYGNSIGPLSGVVIDDNLFFDGEIGISAGYNYRPGGEEAVEKQYPFRMGAMVIKNNIMTQIGRSNPTGRGISWGFMLAGLDSGVIKNNLVINQKTAGINDTRGFTIYGDMRNTTISGNIIYNLQSAVGIRIDENKEPSLGNVFSSNIFQMPFSGKQIAGFYFHTGAGSFNFKDNIYYTSASDGNRFFYSTGNISDAAWVSIAMDSFSTFQQVNYTDSTRDIDTYMESIGETGNIATFIAACRAQNRYEWNFNYSADKINSWIRAGYSNGIQPPKNVVMIN